MNTGQDESARGKVIALEPDLFFAVKIKDTLTRAGYMTRVSRAPVEFEELLRSGEYALALVNTAARGVDWRAGVAAARAASVPVIAYGPHVDLETQAAARAAGAARVIANSRLAELPALVERVIARASNGTTPGDEAEGTSLDAPEGDSHPGGNQKVDRA